MWQLFETVPEGVHVLLYFPNGEKGIGGIECATVYRDEPHLDNGVCPHLKGFSFWTHGGTNSGSDWYPDELPSHWMLLPEPPKK